MDTFEDAKFEDLGPFEDEIDCAVLDDEDFDVAMADAKNAVSTPEEESDEGEEDTIDTNIDYDGSVPEADMVAMDADDMIAAARDIAYDPFEDDELIDIAANGDEIVDDDDFVDDEDY